MRSLVSTELLKIRLTRSTWGFAAAAIVLAAGWILQVVHAAGTAAGVTAGTSEATATLLGASGVGALMLPLFGAAAVSGEFRHETITATLLRTPSRPRVVLAKVLANAISGAALAVVLVMIGMIIGLATGISGPFTLRALVLTGSIVLGAIFYTVLGVCVGLLVRSQTLALVVPLLWFLVVETMVKAYGLTPAVPWLPGSLIGDLGPRAALSTLPPPAVAAATLVLYILVLGAIGIRRLNTADIA